MKKLGVKFAAADLKKFTDTCRIAKVKWEVQETEYNKAYKGTIRFNSMQHFLGFCKCLTFELEVFELEPVAKCTIGTIN